MQCVLSSYYPWTSQLARRLRGVPGVAVYCPGTIAPGAEASYILPLGRKDPSFRSRILISWAGFVLRQIGSACGAVELWAASHRDVPQGRRACVVQVGGPGEAWVRSRSGRAQDGPATAGCYRVRVGIGPGRTARPRGRSSWRLGAPLAADPAGQPPKWGEVPFSSHREDAVVSRA